MDAQYGIWYRRYQIIIEGENHNLGLSTIDQNINSIKKLKAIALDAGDEDKDIFEGIRVLDQQLNNYGIKHDFEIYKGDHLNKIAERIETRMLKFFSDNLNSEQKLKK